MNFIGLTSLETKIAHFKSVGKSDSFIAERLSMTEYEVMVNHVIALDKLQDITKKSESEIKRILAALPNITLSILTSPAILLVLLSSLQGTVHITDISHNYDDDVRRTRTGTRVKTRSGTREDII